MNDITLIWVRNRGVDGENPEKVATGVAAGACYAGRARSSPIIAAALTALATASATPIHTTVR